MCDSDVKNHHPRRQTEIEVFGWDAGKEIRWVSEKDPKKKKKRVRRFRASG